jgi:hypothetical protein
MASVAARLRLVLTLLRVKQTDLRFLSLPLSLQSVVELAQSIN